MIGLPDQSIAPPPTGGRHRVTHTTRPEDKAARWVPAPVKRRRSR